MMRSLVRIAAHSVTGVLLIQRECTKGALVKANLWYDYSHKTKFWTLLPFSADVDDLLAKADSTAAHPRVEDQRDFNY